MPELRSFGVKSVKFGDIPDDGSMSIVLAPFGLTYQDSASLKEADPTVTDVFAEEEDFAVESFEELGQLLLTMSIMDYSPATLAATKGGVVVNGAWQGPSAIVHIEKSVQIITKKDLLVELPRVRLRATINMAMKKKGIDLLDMKAPVLLPIFPGLSPVFIGPYQPPVVNAGADQAIVSPAAVCALVGTAAAYRGAIVSKLWTVTAKPVGANPAITTPDALATGITAMTVDGPYTFTLTATDENGFTSTDSITVTRA